MIAQTPLLAESGLKQLEQGLGSRVYGFLVWRIKWTSRAYMAVSQNGGPQHEPQHQNIMIYILGTPKKVPLILGSPHIVVNTDGTCSARTSSIGLLRNSLMLANAIGNSTTFYTTDVGVSYATESHWQNTGFTQPSRLTWIGS